MKGKVKLKTMTIFLMVVGVQCDFLDELKVSLVNLQATVDKISMEQIRLEGKIEKLETKVITVEDFNGANNNIIDAIDQLRNEIKTLTRVQYLENGCNDTETNESSEKQGSTSLTEDPIDALNHLVKEVEDEIVILVVGGQQKTITKSVEAITTEGTPLCTLPDLPDERSAHTMDNHIMCGGSSTLSSCLYYGAGKWTKYRNVLKFLRNYHVSWQRPDGEVMLIGGWNVNSQKTSEVVLSSGQQEGFNLKHKINNACAIKFDDYLIITGGYHTFAKVSKYDKFGWVKDLPKLKSGRRLHSCGHYYSDTNELIYLVTGGLDVSSRVTDSTEVMAASGSYWTNVGNLPRAAYAMSGISVNNQIFVTGGYGQGVIALDTILKFNSASSEWEKSGELSFARSYHSVAVLPKEEVKPYCL